LTDSINVSNSEDERRKVNKCQRKGTFKARRTLFGTIKKEKRPDTGDSAVSKSHSGIFRHRKTVEDAIAAQDSHGGSETPSTALGLEEQEAKAEKFAGPEALENSKGQGKGKGRAAESRRRRNVYVNLPLAPSEVDHKGQPLARWARNKVRTSKYTLWSFVPKVCICLVDLDNGT